MPGSVVDLAVTGYQVPDPIVVDTNLIVELLVASFPVATPPSPQATVSAQRTNWFFQGLIASNGAGIVTPTASSELLHVAIRNNYENARRQLSYSARQSYGRPINSWRDLYKSDPTILQAFLPNLE